ncbi:Uu.00g131830.m01.CDS01 [Anthostomella pinea]|uniref:Uu.00g131830.m01.CDS01 n=1 Tax=Anthostomella pinea TaxID=933095 RepID=A0AAI8YIA6_9PEZI|nr:Uu.00g131830.m01.CDS01 [Anthostomella pinea]
MKQVTQTDAYMRTPQKQSSKGEHWMQDTQYPSALEAATYAVTKLENDALFNSGHGAVFTRDGINELEASVMVSRGFAKRGVGVTGLKRVKNPILLAKAMLEHGDKDLVGNTDLGWSRESSGTDLDVPSAQGHTLVHGETAETLARKYGRDLVEAGYFFTQKRWDEHVRGLEKEKEGKGTATWSAEAYLPQGTCGAVALDEHGVICVATSTGGMTNKLTGRIGDTPVVGAGFWAEEWTEDGDPGMSRARSVPDPWRNLQEYLNIPGPVVELSSSLRAFLADCLPSPFTYTPITPTQRGSAHLDNSIKDEDVRVTRSVAMSGTGNGDSFLRLAATRTVASIARWSRMPAVSALNRIAGRGGELEKSAGDRWGKTGEGEGGMIGIECVVGRDESGAVLYTRSAILQDHNCAGMFRAWVNDDGRSEMRIWHVDEDRTRGTDARSFVSEEKGEVVLAHGCN